MEFITNSVNTKNMKTTMRVETTYNGIPFGVCKSALQKYIRRSEVDKAIWCAVELDLFANMEGGEKLRTNLIHRLMIITLEDVGVPIFPYLSFLDENLDTLLVKRKERVSEKSLFESNRILEAAALLDFTLLLVNSEHTREFSHIRALTNPALKNFMDENYKDFIVKSHRCSNFKEAGSKMVNAIKEGELSAFDYAQQILFLEEKTCGTFYKKRKSEYYIFHLLEEVGREFLSEDKLKDFLILHKIGMKWFGEIHTKEKFLFWFFLIYILLNKEIDIHQVHREKMDLITVNEWYSKNKNKIEIDDYVIDMHTNIGRRNGKNAVDFAVVGSHVENEWKGTNLKWKEIYQKGKEYQCK